MLENYLQKYISAFKFIKSDELEDIVQYLRSFDKNKKVYVIGNGGSYSLAEHFAQDLLKKCHIPALALSSMSSMTAFSNDVVFSAGYERQIAILGNPGDCLICFSSSGNSSNIFASCSQSKLSGMRLITFTGFDGGMVKRMSDYNIYVPCSDYGIVESIHSILFHYIVDSLI
jgi:D-sedoheptulose 7-phosphate isomerase